MFTISFALLTLQHQFGFNDGFRIYILFIHLTLFIHLINLRNAIILKISLLVLKSDQLMLFLIEVREDYEGVIEEVNLDVRCAQLEYYGHTGTSIVLQVDYILIFMFRGDPDQSLFFQ